MKCKDHLGNEFKSKKEMCEHYGVDYRNVFWRRINSGWTLEEALTKNEQDIESINEQYYELYEGKNGCCVDHLGNYYANVCNMCKCWDVENHAFRTRLFYGWSLEKAITHDNSKKVPDKDEELIWVFGEPFASLRAVDDAYGYEAGSSFAHKDNLEEWLKCRSVFIIDGKMFRSYSAISAEYGLTESCLVQRLDRGWSLEDAVHIPVRHKGNGRPCKDHLGNVYDSKSDMIQHYGLTQSQFRGRVRGGWSLERALTTPAKSYMTKDTKPVEEAIKQ